MCAPSQPIKGSNEKDLRDTSKKHTIWKEITNELPIFYRLPTSLILIHHIWIQCVPIPCSWSDAIVPPVKSVYLPQSASHHPPFFDKLIIIILSTCCCPHQQRLLITLELSLCCCCSMCWPRTGYCRRQRWLFCLRFCCPAAYRPGQFSKLFREVEATAPEYNRRFLRTTDRWCWCSSFFILRSPSN